MHFFNAEQVEARASLGQLRKSVQEVPKRPPKFINGVEVVATEMHYFLDDTYTPPDPRHRKALAHCYRARDGSIGASGKLDPKLILVDPKRHVEMGKSPDCETCITEQMIAPDQRFASSVYRPPKLVP